MTSKNLYSWKLRASITSAAVIWAAFHFWVLYFWFQFSLEISIIESFNATITMTGSAYLWTYIVAYIPQSSRLQSLVVASFLLTVACHYIVRESLFYLGEGDDRYMDFVAQSGPIRIGIYYLVITSSGALMIFYSRLKEQQDIAQRDTATALMVREAELQKLQLQLQPHFLFNSLNSINALILVNPPKAREMVQQLSDFLRETIKRADEKWITLDQEFTYLQLYLSIEKVRFGHRLDVITECDDQIKLWLIPPLLIQPLVENAIKFGLYGTTGNVAIVLKIQRVEDSLGIEITNPFDADMRPAEGSGFGLSGLRRRLYLLYARNDLLKTTTDNNLFSVQLTLPEKTLMAD